MCFTVVVTSLLQIRFQDGIMDASIIKIHLTVLTFVMCGSPLTHDPAGCMLKYLTAKLLNPIVKLQSTFPYLCTREDKSIISCLLVELKIKIH
jgi:hypothetical protein